MTRALLDGTSPVAVCVESLSFEFARRYDTLQNFDCDLGRREIVSRSAHIPSRAAPLTRFFANMGCNASTLAKVAPAEQLGLLEQRKTSKSYKDAVAHLRCLSI